MDREKLVLVDGHSILNRAFYGMPDLTNAAGVHTGAVYGFLNILFKILDEEKADYLTVAFDVHAPTFRHETYAEYKGTRKPMPEELREQVPLVKKVLQAMGVQIREQAGLEADDILGTLARRGEEAGMEVSVVSGDRDLLQIATEHTRIRIPKTRQGQTVIENYYAADVLETYKVTPSAFIDVKALMGDSSDNVPGVPKVGEKTATQLIVDYGSVDGVYSHLDEIKKPALKKNLAENEDKARLSLFLVTIKTDCDICINWEEARVGNLYTPEAFKLYTELGFRAFLPRFDTAAAAENHEELSFRVVAGKEEADELIGELIHGVQSGERPAFPAIGVYPVMDPVKYGEQQGKLYAAAICSGKKAVFLDAAQTGGENGLTEDMLTALLKKLRLAVLSACEEEKRDDSGAEKAVIAVFGLKNQYPVWGIDSEAEFKDGIRLNGFADLLLSCYLCNPLQSDYQPEMAASEYLEESYPTWKQVFDKLTAADAYKEKREELVRYACQMASVLSRAAEPVCNRLAEEGMMPLYKDIERPLSYILYDMERIGIRIRPEALREYSIQLGEQADALAAGIYEACGEQFNIASPKQLGAILFGKLGMPGGKKTKTGYSTAAGVLEKLASEYPVVNDILEYRAVTKLKSTYADGLTAFVAEDGRIHTSFNQTITATGRISSTDPNLQNIPMKTEMGKKIRKAFIPSDGMRFADADYSQIELRILAPDHGLKGLPHAFRRGHAFAEKKREGGQFRDRIRHQLLWPEPGPQHFPQGGGRLYRRLLQDLSRYQGIPGQAGCGSEGKRLCRHHVRPAKTHPGTEEQQFHAALFWRARRDEFPDPGNGSRYHQDRHDPRVGSASERRALLPPDPADPRRAADRDGPRRGGARHSAACPGDGERGRYGRRARDGCAHRKRLVYGQVMRCAKGQQLIGPVNALRKIRCA